MLKRKLIRRTLSRVILVILLLLFLFPIYYLVSTAFKERLLAFAIPHVWFFKPTLENFKIVMSKASFFKALFNSTVVCFCSTILATIFGAPAGFFLARAKNRYKEKAAGWILSTRMAPPIVVIIPFFLLINKLHMFDRLESLIIIYLGFNLPLVVLIMRSFFEDIPIESIFKELQ